MKKIFSKKNNFTISKIGAIILIASIFLVSIGYAALNKDLVVSAIGNVQISNKVKVNGFMAVATSTSDSYANYANYTNTSIDTSVHLHDSSSWVRYQISVANLGNVESGIANYLEDTLPNDLTYEIEGYNNHDMICDDIDQTKCTLGAIKTFYITLKPALGVTITTPSDYIVDLSFDFQPFYNVTYSDNVCNNCVTKALGNTSFSVTLSNYNQLVITMNNTILASNEFSLDDTTDILTINNVTGDIIINNNLYTRLTYIESTGTTDNQYINIDYVPNKNTTIEYDGMIVSGDTALFGSRDAARNAKSKYTLQYISSGNYRFSLVNNDLLVSKDYILGQRYLFKKDVTGLLINNDVVGIYTPALNDSFSSVYPLYVFAINTNNVASNFGVSRLYEMKIYENDILIRRYIPVLDSNGVACLYETENKNFYYNSGNGNFNYTEPTTHTITNNMTTVTSSNTSTSITLGETYITTFTPTTGNEMPEALIITSNNLPLVRNVDYTYDDTTGILVIRNISGDIAFTELTFLRLDYLRSSGSQYIDTGYIPTPNTKVVFTHIPTITSPTPWVTYFGSRNGSNNTNAFYSSAGLSSGIDNISAWVGNIHLGGGNLVFSHIVGSVEVITLSSTEYTIVVNGTTMLSVSNSTTPLFTNPNSMFIFGRNIGDGTLNAGGDIKFVSMQIYENNVLVKDFVPSIDPDGILCLYEEIEEIYYYNAGTGSFVAP